MGRLLALSLIALFAGSARAADCDPAGLSGLRGILPKLQRELAVKLTMETISEACKSLPAPILKVMPADAATPARAKLIADALDEAKPFAKAACPEFPKVMASASAASRDDRPGILFRGCGYSRLGLMTEKEFVSVGQGDMSGPLLAPPMFRWMIDHKVDSGLARQLCRAIAGLN